MYDLLRGMRVLEAASFVAAPSCTLHLQQMGAEIVRIDQIGGGPDFKRWPLSPSEQRMVHGFAWVATQVATPDQPAGWAERLDLAGRLGEGELLVDTLALDPAVRWFVRNSNTPKARASLARALTRDWQADQSLSDEMLDMVRDQFRQFTDERVAPFAHAWHLADDLIPDSLNTAVGRIVIARGLLGPQM